MKSSSLAVGLFLIAIFGSVFAEDIGPDTCGQDRKVLSSWFISHGSPRLLLAPLPPLFMNVTEDPYEDPNKPPLSPEDIPGFCAMQWSNETDPESGNRLYTLQNFDTVVEAQSAGFIITHEGQCAACSSLQDLGVYMSRNLTTPTRWCGVLGLFSPELEIQCMKDLGFSEECASIWHWNVKNTRSKCLEVCIKSFIEDEPFNKPDGSLNDCLQCDEDLSGPNFKYYSGRTRRNSGIPSAIQRPESQIYDMEHCYWYGTLDFPSDNSTESIWSEALEFLG
ncbi:hypothetical protein TCAL_08181 [Tigriopus californicus]|uniref:Folate receptor-like domain-containing protein n=1 Tax=Tigriopus californicus TaxID=6832 RepID=A0A553P7E8_TIGCA|nr:uncharacterized protein LOC131878437 [Tigriopus californicus]TRY73604.1 hypothetical protein TCAL_08181 [Tigriopus californicus]